MLAIIIPYYKIDFFEETLHSLANQTNKNFKVYIGDDASPDSPEDILKKFHGKFDFVYHRFEKNLGSVSLTKQWERCIDLSGDEEWLMILGDDDFLGNTVVELWYQKFDAFFSKSEVIRFATKIVEQQTNSVSETYFHPIWERATESFYRKFTHLTRSSLSEHIFTRKAFLKYRFTNYPLAWNSDDRAWLDFSGKKPIYSINDSVVFVRISSVNISGKIDNIEKKNLSVIAFYKFLIEKKIKYYSVLQREKIIRFYENEIKKQRDLKLSEWLFLLFFYLKYLDFNSIKKFSKRFLKNILKRNE